MGDEILYNCLKILIKTNKKITKQIIMEKVTMIKKTLYDFKEQIIRLPLKEKYTKDDILIPEFLIEKEEELEIFYAPHNEYINPNAKVFIIGITPGFQQMSTAIATARKQLELGISIQEIQYACKVAGRFSGAMRKNIITMLDDIKLNERLHLMSCRELFEKEDHLLHTVSLIPYSVFVKKQNYSGHTPKIMKSSVLSKYIYENFKEELYCLSAPEEVLLIPLGKAVEEVLVHLVEEGILKKGQILYNFPHPSGANVNRIPQLNANKEEMTQFLKSFFHIKYKK